jgi:hypothetical protein
MPGVSDSAEPLRTRASVRSRIAFWVPDPMGAPEQGFVGSRTGAVLRRFGLSVSPRFLWECLTVRTVSPFPAPATSNVASGFPALRSPAGFTPSPIRPQAQIQLSQVVALSCSR